MLYRMDPVMGTGFTPCESGNHAQCLSESPGNPYRGPGWLNVPCMRGKESQAGLWPGISASGVYNRTLKNRLWLWIFGGEQLKYPWVQTTTGWEAFLSLPLVAPLYGKTVQLSALDIDLWPWKNPLKQALHDQCGQTGLFLLPAGQRFLCSTQRNYDNVALNANSYR